MSLRLSECVSQRLVTDLQSILENLRGDPFGGDPTEFAVSYLQTECLSKLAPMSSEKRDELRSTALSTFFMNEERCRLSNERWAVADLHTSIDPAILRRARHLIARILGPCDLNELPMKCGFGPGASTGIRRGVSQPQNKWERSSHVTSDALPYAEAFMKFSGWHLPLVEVDTNRVTTVPKNRKTDRIIAIEPDWNGFLQKGLGKMIRTRLRRRGLLHPDSQDIHGRLALRGATVGDLATLDLSNASDTIGLVLVRQLLPPDWFRVLYHLRSHAGLIDDRKVQYEKISSMGNGYTFELETLIFYSLVVASMEKGCRLPVSVYGDDIICSSAAYDRVVDTLHSAGFSINDSKSFTSPSLFRESCGHHYYGGHDVTPFYVRRNPVHVLDVINLHNKITTWLHRNVSRRLQCSDLEDYCADMRRYVPRKFRGPYGLDGVLWSDRTDSVPQWSRRFQCQRVSRLVGLDHKIGYFDHMGAVRNSLWNGYVEEADGNLYRKATIRVKETAAFFYPTQWAVCP